MTARGNKPRTGLQDHHHKSIDTYLVGWKLNAQEVRQSGSMIDEGRDSDDESWEQRCHKML